MFTAIPEVSVAEFEPFCQIIESEILSLPFDPRLITPTS